MSKISFPLRLVESFDNGIWRARRGCGPVVAEGVCRFGDAAPAEARIQISAETDERIAFTGRLCEHSLRLLTRRLEGSSEWVELIRRELAGRELALSFLAHHEFLLEVNPQEGRLYLACDAASALGMAAAPDFEAENRLGLEVLLALGQFHLFLCLAGWTRREALHATLALYSSFPPAERACLHQLLRGSVLDSGNLFSLFLERACSGGDEDERAWRNRQITWLLGQDRVDLPYDREQAIAILRQEDDLDEKRNRLYRLVKTYDRPLERGNIERIAGECRKDRQAVIFGRMSRAFHNQAELFADSVLLQPGPHWPALADQIAALIEDSPVLQASAGCLQALLSQPAEVALTELEGACERFEETVLELQKQEMLDALRQSRTRMENHNDESSRPAPLASHKDILAHTERRLRLVERLRREFLEAEKRHAAFVVISQRPSPSGSHLLVKSNEFEEPYRGRSENLRKLATLAADRVYCSPDYGWLEEADHWIEAIPLFIKEEVLLQEGHETTLTVIDIAGMEESFREEMADLWARNLRQVRESEFLCLGREILAQRDFPRPDESSLYPGVSSDDIAALGLLIGEIYRREARRILRRVEREEISPYRALALDLPDHPWLQQARMRQEKNGSWTSTVREILAEQGYAGDFEAELERLKPKSGQPRRPLPALHVLTTQSAGMSWGYIGSWLEESMALYNIAEDLDLHGEVKARQDFFEERIRSLGEKIIRELGLWVEVEEIRASETIDLAMAVRRVIDRNPMVQEEICCLGALLEYEEMEYGRGMANRYDEARGVEERLSLESADLRETALDRVAERNGEELQQRVREYRQNRPGISGREALHRVVEEDDYWREDLAAYLRFAARHRELARLDLAYPKLYLAERCSGYLRRFGRLAKTTARKEVIAERGLNHLTLDPFYYFQATGGGKRYHLLYTPSRVDLGEKERESVENWSQWVGGADRAAALAGGKIYRLINKDVRIFGSLTEPEILKTGENAAMVSHFGFSNALAMMVNASLHGDFEEMAERMNRRRDRLVHPAGEGYGGYCVPKDGLFLEFVLTLGQREKLRQIGLPEDCHRSAVILAQELLARRPEFTTRLEWEEWAGERLQQAEFVKPYFHLRQGLPVFQATRIALVLENLGKPELRDPFRITANLAARWGLHKMVTGGERINRFMPFFKTWLIHLALAEAARRHPGVKLRSKASVVVLTAEYKPDTQDGRFSAGMRKFEILAGTGDHLLHALDLEGQEIAILMQEGYAGLERRGRGRRLLELLEMKPDDAMKVEQVRRLFPAHPSPGEIRMVSTTDLSTRDLLNYTSDTRLDAHAEEALQKLLALGLSQKEVEANLRTWGLALNEWDHRAVLSPEIKQQLQIRLSGRLHPLALKLLGPERDYRRAVRGADLLDVGIPHRSLLELLGQPAQLCRLMLDGNPDSALCIVDGASGARHRAMNRLDVMLWFAAGEYLGREPVYRAIGLGEETVQAWRTDMRRQRQRAKLLLQALADHDDERAQRHYHRMIDTLREEQEVQAMLLETDKLRGFARDRERDYRLGQSLVRLAKGVPLAELNFDDFLGLGGVFLLTGADDEELAAARAIFDDGIARMGTGSVLADDRLAGLLLHQAEPVEPHESRLIRGVESSNKAVEEQPERALQLRRQLAQRIVSAKALNERQAAFSAVACSTGNFEAHHRLAMETLGSGEDAVSEADFGAFLAHTRNALWALNGEFSSGKERALGFHDRIGRLFNGGKLDLRLWHDIAGGYEDMGDFGRLAQQAFEQNQAETRPLERIAKAGELFYIALAADSLIGFTHPARQESDSSALWRALADFFADTLNDHHHEYRPWIYSRGIGFACYQGEALYRLAVEHHRWLYHYLRFVATHYTELQELSAEDQDQLLGAWRETEFVEPIAAGAAGEAERIWRAYGQLRELAFIRNDGFPLPVVFLGFDPELIRDRQRVNHVIAAPVGRTHFSRALREGPTLSRQLEREGRPGANLLITRQLEIHSDPRHPRPVAKVHSAYFYLDDSRFRLALVQLRNCSPEAAAHLAFHIHPKGVLVAARFSRPLLAALVYPFHGDPLYDAGKLEECGLPYTVQSLFHTWTTYDKAKYPEIFRHCDVGMPAEIDWLAAYTASIGEETAAKHHIRDGMENADYPGLLAFSFGHPRLMVKDAAESGGRNMRAFMLRRGDGDVDEEQMEQAVDFIYQISLKHNAAIQEIVASHPECWATEEFMRAFVHRQIVDWGSPVNRLRRPTTSLYGSHRIILSTDDPGEPDLAKKWHISHWITLNSKQLITNVGRGGTLEQFLPEFIREEHRLTLMDKLAEAGRQVMEALARYESQAADLYRRESGREVGKDLMGVSYGMPRYMMLDFLIAPLFAEEGRLVEIRPCYDRSGHRSGSQFILRQGERLFPGTLCDWRVVLIEPNIGVGLWDRLALREEFHELNRARTGGEDPDWDRIGENARIVLKDLNRAGEDYLRALWGNDGALG
ncbi:MAG: hypothetical protein PHE55_03880 [Methylococcaceae bacterium]|nr:hypothetical protein [Methylococcaceae bacterium]